MAAGGVTVGSLCSGVGGLDLAAHLLFGDVRLVWTAETDPAAARVLAARWPGVPNLGDIRGGLDAPTVDVVTAGFPCQPVSQAGRRRGAADPRWLWGDYVDAINRHMAAVGQPAPSPDAVVPLQAAAAYRRLLTNPTLPYTSAQP